MAATTRLEKAPCHRRRMKASRRGGPWSMRIVSEGEGHPGNSLLPVGVPDGVGAAAVVETETGHRDQVRSGVVDRRIPAESNPEDGRTAADPRLVLARTQFPVMSLCSASGRA